MNGHSGHPLSLVRKVGERGRIFVLALSGAVGLQFFADEDDLIAEKSWAARPDLGRNGLVETDRWQGAFRPIIIHPEELMQFQACWSSLNDGLIEQDCVAQASLAICWPFLS